MKYSLSYYLTLFVIRLKGIKKTFDTDPINYKKLRKEDVPVPRNKYFRQKSRLTTLLGFPTLKLLKYVPEKNRKS